MDAGDFVLKKVSIILSDNIRTEDIVCRYGGEEFLLVIPGASIEVSIRHATELLEIIRNKDLSHKGSPLGKLTISIGIASIYSHGEDPKLVIAAADKALYQAKKNGRDQFVIAEPDN